MHNFLYFHSYFILKTMKTLTCFDPWGIIIRESVLQLQLVVNNAWNEQHKIISAQQARDIYQYKNIKEKVYAIDVETPWWWSLRDWNM